jgi:hypothetical protein
MKNKPKVQKKAVIFFIIVFIIIFIIAYNNQDNSFWYTILTGIDAGLFVAIAQYLVSLAEYKEIQKAYDELYDKEKEIEEFKKMGVKKVLSARDDPEVYGTIIEKAEARIWVMGNTASRLLEDFANEEGSTEYKSVLLDFLQQGGEVRILIANKRYLFKDEDKKRFDIAKNRLAELSKKYEKFQVRYYKHIPTHSIFVFDDYCLLGPIFDNLSSKATPVLGMDIESEYAQKYINYFNHQWESAEPINDL